MFVFYEKYSPRWVSVKIKLHALVNELHTTACCKKIMVFWVELVEVKEKPNKGPYDESKFGRDFETKFVVLAVRMTEPLWGSERDVTTSSGFVYVTSVVHIINRGLLTTTVVKKMAHQPQPLEAQEAVNNIKGQHVVTARARKWTVAAENERVYMVALDYSLHTPSC